jgi:hypothetical protein
MKLRGTLFTAAVATLLWAVSVTPASAALAGSAKSSTTSVSKLFGVCSPMLYFTQAGPATVSLYSSMYCGSSIDSIYIDLQIKRNGSIVAYNTCGTLEWSLTCTTDVACQPGSYQGFAQYTEYSTSGNYSVLPLWTGVQYISC